LNHGPFVPTGISRRNSLERKGDQFGTWSKGWTSLDQNKCYWDHGPRDYVFGRWSEPDFSWLFGPYGQPDQEKPRLDHGPNWESHFEIQKNQVNCSFYPSIPDTAIKNVSILRTITYCGNLECSGLLNKSEIITPGPRQPGTSIIAVLRAPSFKG
jgi:hypothetical protein